jgi:hypothetical protein
MFPYGFYTLSFSLTPPFAAPARLCRAGRCAFVWDNTFRYFNRQYGGSCISYGFHMYLFPHENPVLWSRSEIDGSDVSFCVNIKSIYPS